MPPPYPTDPASSAGVSDRTTTTHLPALDGLRGIAVLLVMLCHFLEGQPRYSGLSLRVLFGFSDSAWCGVDLFFVLSGFLITGILYDSKHGRHYFGAFYMRRILRIFPLYYGFLLVALIIVPWALSRGGGQAVAVEHQEWLWFFGANILMGLRQAWMFDEGPLWLGHFWSLAVEEQFYLVWPLLVLLLTRQALMRLCVLLSGIALTARVLILGGGANELPAYVFTHCRMDSLVVGAFVALAARSARGAAALVGPAKVFAIASGGGLLLLIWLEGGRLAYDDWRTQTVGFSVLAVFFGALLALAAFGQPSALWRRLCSTYLLRRLGRYSYALYVFHVPLVPFLNAILPATLLAQWAHSYRLGLGIYLSIAITASVLLALLSWHFFEKHFLTLKRFFPYGFQHAASGKPAGAAGSGRVAVSAPAVSSAASVGKISPLPRLDA